MLEYQHQEARLTLGDGLREYYASREGLVGGRGISEAARTFFRCHDAAHVVFGCTTSLPDEGVVKLWSFFGTTAGLRLLRDYRLPESQEIYEQLGWREMLAAARTAIPAIPRVLWRARQMRKRWPWSGFEGYLGVPLGELRREFGIRLLTR
jgi:hypothetical protein